MEKTFNQVVYKDTKENRKIIFSRGKELFERYKEVIIKQYKDEFSEKIIITGRRLIRQP